MRIIDLALKDLYQILRDRKVAAMLVLMPIGFTVFFSMLFGGAGGGGEADPRLPIGWIDRDISSERPPLLRLGLSSPHSIRKVAAGFVATTVERSDRPGNRRRRPRIAASRPSARPPPRESKRQARPAFDSARRRLISSAS